MDYRTKIEDMLTDKEKEWNNERLNDKTRIIFINGKKERI